MRTNSVLALVAAFVGGVVNAQAATRAPKKDPLGFVGTWIEYWPGLEPHDVNVISYQKGRYSVQVRNPKKGPCRVGNVRLDGNSLKFIEYPGTKAVHYELRAQDADTLAVRVRGGRGSGQGIVWRRQGAPEPGALTIAPDAGLVVVMRWQTQGTDVDLFVTDPSGRRRRVLNDDRSGPGQEICIVRHPTPGDYRIAVVYYNTQGGQTTPVTVEVGSAGKLQGTYKAVLRPQDEDERKLVHTVRVPPGAGPAPERAEGAGDLVVMMRWATQGTDVDLYVVDPNGERCRVSNDVRRGPGQETCVVRSPMPGNYRIEALYYNSQGGQKTPVSVEVRLGGRLRGTYRALLERDRDKRQVHIFTVKP